MPTVVSIDTASGFFSVKYYQSDEYLFIELKNKFDSSVEIAFLFHVLVELLHVVLWGLQILLIVLGRHEEGNLS